MKKVIILLSLISISFFISPYPVYGNTPLSDIERGSVTRKPQPGRKGEMDPERFSEFLNRVREAPFKRQKMEFLDTVLPYTRFSSLQCKEIANAFAFTSEKKEVLKKLYPYAADPQYYSYALEALTFSSEKREIEEYIRHYNEKEKPKNSRPHGQGQREAQDFPAFLSRLKENSFASDKMKLLDTVLPHRRFTSLECKEIANTFSFDREKKEVLKKLYPHVSDPQHYSYALEALIFSIDRKEVQNYIEEYKESRRPPGIRR